MVEWLALASEALLAAMLSTLGTGLSLVLSRPPPAGAHWAEQARATWTARLAGRLGGMMAAMLALAAVYVFSGPVTDIPLGAHLSALFLAAVAPAVVLTMRRERALTVPGRPWAVYLQGRAAYTVALRGQLLVLLGLGSLAFVAPALATLPLVLLGAVSAWGFARGAGVDLAARLGLARAASPGLVERLRQRPGGQVIAGVHILDTHVANAFALPVSGRLVFTQAALDTTDDHEQDAITDHELGHLNEPPSIVRTRVAMSLAVTPLIALGPIGRAHPLAAIALIGVVVVVLLLGRRMQARMEHRADEHAHDGDAQVYARALERLYEHNRVPAVLGRGVHADLYDRLVAAGAPPTWPRPEPPSRWRPRLAVAAAVFAMCLVIVPLRVAIDMLGSSLPDSPAAWTWGGPAR